MSDDTADARKVAERLSRYHHPFVPDEVHRIHTENTYPEVLAAITRAERKLIAYQQETNLHDMIQGPCKCGATHTVEETVHNIEARAEAAEAKLKYIRRSWNELGVAVDVRQAEVDSLRAKLQEAHNVIDADDKRLSDAAIKVWGEHRWGCDTPDHMADAILALRAKLKEMNESLVNAHVVGLKFTADFLEAEARLAAMIHEGDAEASRIRAALNLPEDGRSLEEQIIEYGKSK